MSHRFGFRAGAALAVVAVLAGCGTQTADTADTADPGAPADSNAGATSPSLPESSATAGGTTDDSDPAERPGGLKSRLLPAEQLPGFNAQFSWTAKATKSTEGDVLAGTCHKFAMTSIGAMRVVRRTYAPADVSSPSSASELVAEFPDVKTAKRAYAVLAAWHDKCGGDREVGELVPVDVEPATGTWYLVTSGTTFAAQAFSRHEARVAVLTMTTEVQDYDYPAGHEPMVKALQRATALL